MSTHRQSTLRFRLRSIFALTAIMALVLTAYTLWPIDGSSAVTGPYTVFADGYSDAGWRAVGIGGKRLDVYARLGLPINVARFTGGYSLEEWSCSVISPGQYRRRAIGFKGDTVVFKKAEVTRQRPFINLVSAPRNPVFE